jgi:Tat protein translocase TatB subunit
VFNIGPMELMIILAVALLVVGPKRLPELGRTVGKSLRELRKVQDDLKRTIELEEDAPSFDRPPSRSVQPEPDPDRHRHYFDDDDEDDDGEEQDAPPAIADAVEATKDDDGQPAGA